jgi:hypothetical protein
VHHIDGDKGNNSAGNLLLVECSDHMRLHGSATFIRPRRVPTGKWAGRPLAVRNPRAVPMPGHVGKAALARRQRFASAPVLSNRS